MTVSSTAQQSFGKWGNFLFCLMNTGVIERTYFEWYEWIILFDQFCANGLRFIAFHKFWQILYIFLNCLWRQFVQNELHDFLCKYDLRFVWWLKTLLLNKMNELSYLINFAPMTCILQLFINIWKIRCKFRKYLVNFGLTLVDDITVWWNLVHLGEIQKYLKRKYSII